MPHLLGYARVSTVAQDEALQVDALKAAGCARIYTDHVSTRKETRPELERLFERVDAGGSTPATPSSCGGSIDWAGRCRN